MLFAVLLFKLIIKRASQAITNNRTWKEESTDWIIMKCKKMFNLSVNKK